MNPHPTAVCTGLAGHFHAIDPSGEVGKIIWAHHSSVPEGILNAHGELLFRGGEVLEASEGVLIVLRLRKCQINVVRPRLEAAEVDAILDQLVSRFVEVEEFIHLFNCRHSPKGVGRMR
jgi:hypothetical protein